MPEINYTNPQINKIKKQDISIQVSLNGFTYAIRASETKNCLLFRHFKFNNVLLIDELIRNTENLINSESKLTGEFENAEVTLISQNSIIVPGEIFKPEYLKKYFEFSQNFAELDELNYTAIPGIDAYNVFSIPGYFSQLFYSLYLNVTFCHQATNLINYGFTNTDKTNPTVVIGLNPAFFDLVVFENKKLILSNSYQYSNSSDFIYFFLYALKQLKIEIEKLNVIVLGESNNNSALIDELANEVSEVIIPDLSGKSNYASLSQKQVSQFYNLF